MTGLRRPDQDAVLPAAEAASMRRVLTACSGLLSWAQANCGPQCCSAQAIRSVQAPRTWRIIATSAAGTTASS